MKVEHTCASAAPWCASLNLVVQPRSLLGEANTTTTIRIDSIIVIVIIGFIRCALARTCARSLSLSRAIALLALCSCVSEC